MPGYLNEITQGDSYEVLKALPDASVDAVVTDPPYGLSKEPDIAEVLTHWLNDQEYKHPSKGFMGKDWDSFVPSPALWREVYRVLKPGGHVLCFAGTRTQDLMTIALRLAGFEIRDVLEWLYLTGFPKSLDVGKAFDKAAGVEPEIIGVKYSRNGTNGTNNEKFKQAPRETTYITAPVTELAQKWYGWGTALKPAHEPIILVRKPIDKTVCHTIEQHGTGAINIDGCLTDLARFPANVVTTGGDQWYSEYFNVTAKDISKKASKADRNADHQGNVIDLPVKQAGSLKMRTNGSLDGHITTNRNTHPTVKPTGLMAWLIRLITPPGGTVLDG